MSPLCLTRPAPLIKHYILNCISIHSVTDLRGIKCFFSLKRELRKRRYIHLNFLPLFLQPFITPSASETWFKFVLAQEMLFSVSHCAEMLRCGYKLFNVSSIVAHLLLSQFPPPSPTFHQLLFHSTPFFPSPHPLLCLFPSLLFLFLPPFLLVPTSLSLLLSPSSLPVPIPFSPTSHPLALVSNLFSPSACSHLFHFFTCFSLLSYTVDAFPVPFSPCLSCHLSQFLFSIPQVFLPLFVLSYPILLYSNVSCQLITGQW